VIHPDRFAIVERFVDDAARAQHLESDVFKSFINLVTNELKILKEVQYSNGIEHEAFGWLCRDVEHQEDAKNRTLGYAMFMIQ
jgi:hypothetical protein